MKSAMVTTLYIITILFLLAEGSLSSGGCYLYSPNAPSPGALSTQKSEKRINLDFTAKSKISTMPIGINIADCRSTKDRKKLGRVIDANKLELETLVNIRGGQAISGKKRKSKGKAFQELVQQVKPATRVYLAVAVFCTLVHIIGLPAPAIFSLDISRIYEIWRPITAMAYLGGPSMSMANNMYFLVRYGQVLESEFGTGAHAWFLIVQTVILSILGWVLGFPNQAQAMISAAVYVSSHMNPMERMPFQFGFMITSWQLPYCLMIIDCLSMQSLAAAWPHVLGIFSGHIYHFFTKVWPGLGGKARLLPPQWIIAKFGGKPKSNVAGLDFRKGEEDSKKGKGKGGKSNSRSQKNSSLSQMKKDGKVRKLGTSNKKK